MIEMNTVTKKFGDFTALDQLSLQIPKGAVYGLVGPNGAGKSTAIRLLTGVYRPDSGSITLEGAPIYENPAVKSRICSIFCSSYIRSPSFSPIASFSISVCLRESMLCK